MDIKDAYLHSTVGVVKSINVDKDNIIYTLADVANTTNSIALPLVTSEYNGLVPKITTTTTRASHNDRVLSASSDGKLNWRLFPTYYKQYTSLDSLPTDGSLEAWYSIALLHDTQHMDSNCIFVIKAYAHSSAIFTACKGWGETGNITLLSYCNSYNAGYAYVKGARITKDGVVLILLNVPKAEPGYVSISIGVYGAMGILPNQTLSLSSAIDEDSIIDTKLFVNNSMMAKTFVGDLIGNADSSTNALNINVGALNTNGDYPLLFTQNVTSGNKKIYTDTETALSYNPSTNTLKAKALEIATGDLILQTLSNGNTPSIIFRRGTLNDAPIDWRVYNNSSGLFTIQGNTGEEGWVNMLTLEHTSYGNALKSSLPILPTKNNVLDLGSNAAKWANIYSLSFVGNYLTAKTGDLTLEANSSEYIYLRVGTDDTSSIALTSLALLPTYGSKNILNLGSASNKWKSVYATEFVGDLKGTASKWKHDYDWDAVCTIGLWSKILNITGYTSILLSCQWGRTAQVILNTYLITTGYLHAKIILLNSNGYPSNAGVELRVTSSDINKFCVEVLNNHSTNTPEITFKCRAISIGRSDASIVPIEIFTEGSDTVKSSLVSSKSISSNLNADMLDGAHLSELLRIYDHNKTSLDLVNSPSNSPALFNLEGSKLIEGYYDYWYVFNIGRHNGGSFNSQIAVPYQNAIKDSELFIRTANNTTWREWRRVLHSNNYTDYTVSKDGTGATGTWNINISGTAATATKLNTKRKLWGLDFDGSADVNGALSGVTDIIATASLALKSSNAAIYLRYNDDDNSSICLASDALIPTTASHNKLNLGRIANKWKGVYASAFYGNLNGSYVNALTGYTKATAIGSIAATDSLNTALGKLEYKTDFIYNDLFGTDNDDVINKWSEIVSFIDSVKETETDILDTFVTRKTNQEITGIKTFKSGETFFQNGDFGVRLLGHGNSGWLQLGQISGTNKIHLGAISGIGGSDLSDLLIRSASSTFGGNVTAVKFITKDGTSSQFVKGDGSLDDTVYATTASLGNYVTLDTDLTITGQKTFDKTLIATNNFTIKSKAVNQTPRIVFDEYWTSDNPSWKSEIISDYYGKNVCSTDNFTHGLYVKLGRPTFDNFIILNNYGSPIARISKDKGHWFDGTLTTTGTIRSPRFIGSFYTKWVDSINSAGCANSNLGWFSLEYSSVQSDTIGFPCINNANGILWLGTHGHDSDSTKIGYGHQLGFSGNGKIYHRYIASGTFPTTNTWKLLAFIPDIPTKVSQLTNDSGYLTSRGYIGTTAVQESSQNQSLTGINDLTLSGDLTLYTASGDSPAIVFHRGNIGSDTSVDWRIYVTAGHLKIQNALKTINSGAWVDVLHFEADLASKVLTSSYHIVPVTTNTRTLGTSALKWSNVYATNFTGNLTGNVTGSATYLPITQINNESEINSEGIRGYSGSGTNWTGMDTMAYAAILSVGNASRGFRLWSGRGSSCLKYCIGNAEGNAWVEKRDILDSNNHSNYTPVSKEWEVSTTVGAWSKILNIAGYVNITLSVTLSQNTQASIHTYLISTGYGSAKIIQLGYNGFISNANASVRITKSSELSYSVEILNNYGYNGATKVSIKCKATINNNDGSIEPLTYYTAGSGTVCHELVSSGEKASNFNADMLDGKHASDFVDISSNLEIGGNKSFTNTVTTNKLHLANVGGSWTSGMTKAAIMYDSYTALNANQYHPIIGVKTNGENVVNLGAYINSVGFYGYKKGRTENDCDWKFSFNSETGDLTHTGASITAKKFVKNGGTSSQFLKADGSVDSNSYAKTSDLDQSGFNKILFERFNRGTITGGNPITEQDLVGKTLIDSTLVDNFKSFNVGDYYLGRLTTYLYFSQATEFSTSAYSDDGSTLYLNDAVVVTLTTCVATDITLNFIKGWNKIVWVFNENGGGDSAYFTPSIKTASNLLYMNAFPVATPEKVHQSYVSDASRRLESTTVIASTNYTLSNKAWSDTTFDFTSLATGTYAVQVTSGTNLVASGIMSVYNNLSDSMGDEIPLHVYGTAGWRPYLRTYQNKLLISSNDASATSRTVTIKIAQIL